MALQTSGEISLIDIQTELSASTASLTQMSIAASKTAPHGIKEFYGYDANPPTPSYKAFYSSSRQTAASCSASNSATFGFYGSGTLPEIGDVTYISPSGGKFLPAGYYTVYDSSSSSTADSFIQVGSSGVITDKGNC